MTRKSCSATLNKTAHVWRTLHVTSMKAPIGKKNYKNYDSNMALLKPQRGSAAYRYN